MNTNIKLKVATITSQFRSKLTGIRRKLRLPSTKKIAALQKEINAIYEKLDDLKCETEEGDSLLDDRINEVEENIPELDQDTMDELSNSMGELEGRINEVEENIPDLDEDDLAALSSSVEEVSDQLEAVQRFATTLREACNEMDHTP